MKILQHRFLPVGVSDLSPFWERLKAAPRRILMLDYDGTLAPFRVERDQATPYEFIPPLLDRILAVGRTRVVIISGRAIADVLPLLGLKLVPEVWGSHGWERMAEGEGKYELGDIGDEARHGLDEARAEVDGCGIPSERIEYKPVSIAVHWRGLDGETRGRIEEKFSAAWKPIAERWGLDFHPFDGGIELRAAGRTKGYVVEKILSSEPAEAVAAYLGDDRTDEDAFEALGNRALAILCRRDPRPTSAEVWIQPPEELREFMEKWLYADELSPLLPKKN